MAGNGLSFKTLQPKKRAFLLAYAELGIVTYAAKAAQIHRLTHNDWLKTDAVYAADFEVAKEGAADRLEREALRRAVEGWDEPIVWRGEVTGMVRRYSDTLLIFMLKGAKPEKYRERFEHSGPGGGPIAVVSDGGPDRD